MTKLFPNEGDVKKEVKKLLDAHGWFFWMTPGNGFGTSGVSDFFAVRGGVFMAVETKKEDKEPTPLQVAFLNSIRAERGFAFWVKPSTVEHLAAWLGAFDRAIIAVQAEGKPTPEDGAMMLNCIAALTEGMADPFKKS